MSRVAGVLIGFYVSDYLVGNTKPFRPAVRGIGGTHGRDLTIETVAAVGPTLAPNPDWVSYLVRDDAGHWMRSTVFTLPAHATVHVTIYNFDGASGLRNPLFGRPPGLVGPELVDGKPLVVMPPDQPSHTFAVPALGRARPDRAGRRRREEPVRLRAVRAVDRRTARSPSRSGRARPATTAGSASSRAPPGSCTASAGRCRRSATWTAS